MKAYLKIFSVWLIIILGFDFCFGSSILNTFYYRPNNSRVSNKIFHHTFATNAVEKEYWGPIKYDFCTNKFGFKISCENDYEGKEFDIAFIGDSFTEAVGLSYEESFVGIIDKSLDTLNIANLGVASYSYSIYLSKVNFFLKNNINFKELVVYPDISDIQDEALTYFLKEDLVVAERNYNKIGDIKLFFRWMFPANYLFLNKIKKYFFNSENIRMRKRAEWTYNLSSDAYGEIGIAQSVKESLDIMDTLYELLKSQNIDMSIGVYPWPEQLKNDSVNSVHVEMWKKFSKERGIKFYNSFPIFFNLVEDNGLDYVLKKYFNENDVHFNHEGSKIIAKDFLDNRIVEKPSKKNFE